VSGNASKNLDYESNEAIIANLTDTLSTYIRGNQTSLNPKGYFITRWEQDEYSLGSTSFYTVNMTEHVFKQLATPIQSRLWLVG